MSRSLALALVCLLAASGTAKADLRDTAPPMPPRAIEEADADGEAPRERAALETSALTDVATPVSAPMLYHPSGPGEGRWVLGLGATTDVLATALVESEVRVLPRVHTAFRYGLPAGFTLDTSLDSIVMTNELRLGIRWAIDLGPITLGLSDHIGLVFGHVIFPGFDTTTLGMSHYPGASLGFRLGPHAVSLGFKTLLAHMHFVRFGDSSVGQRRTIFHGVSFELMFESQLGDGRLFYGATVFRASPDYQLWLVFSDSDLKLEFVRFKVGYAF
ncbi:MAG: hypothetical protein ACPGU1_20045 [Myxococcota bacterium]